MRRIFVGNLSPDTREDDVRELFSQYGTVRSLKLNVDVFSGKCRGFGLVEMEGHEARAALAALDGKTLPEGGFLKVRFEQPRRKRRGGR